MLDRTDAAKVFNFAKIIPGEPGHFFARAALASLGVGPSLPVLRPQTFDPSAWRLPHGVGNAPKRNAGMSIFDKIVSAVAPLASPEERAEARRRAEAMAQGPDDWLSLALDHHRQIDRLFVQAKTASDVVARRSAFKQLAVVLTGHANAEESVIYPMLAQDHKAHAAHAYQEQAMAKVEMHLLEMLEPMSQDWLDKLAHIESAVQQHVYEEESELFGEVREAMREGDAAMHSRRFREEFERYCGGEQGGERPLQMAAQMTERDTQQLSPNDGSHAY